MNSVYENYMRSVLGYEPVNFNYRNTYEHDCFEDIDYTNHTMFQQTNDNLLEDCYPDIYKLVYPMVQKTCMQNRRNISNELIEEMTDEIYFAIEDDNLNRGIEQRKTNSTENCSTTNQKTDNKFVANVQNNRSIENSQEGKRQIARNSSLRDLIKILILRELIDRPGFRPRPPRPPFPPGQNQPRPPMRPSIF